MFKNTKKKYTHKEFLSDLGVLDEGAHSVRGFSRECETVGRRENNRRADRAPGDPGFFLLVECVLVFWLVLVVVTARLNE